MFTKFASTLSIYYCLISLLFINACTTNEKVAIKPATILSRDVFTCKGLSPNNHWVGVTDQFDPVNDPRVVLVANFAPSDMDTRVQYEFLNPLDNIVIVETIERPKNNPLGIYVEMSRLLELGGEGEWQANVYANTRPIGQAIFHIGEKEDVEDGITTEYFVVGEESLEEEPAPDYENQTFDTYIEEVTPEIEIPATNALDYLEDIEGAPSYTDEQNLSGEIEEAEAVGDVAPLRNTNIMEEAPVTP